MPARRKERDSAGSLPSEATVEVEIAEVESEPGKFLRASDLREGSRARHLNATFTGGPHRWARWHPNIHMWNTCGTSEPHLGTGAVVVQA